MTIIVVPNMCSKQLDLAHHSCRYKNPELGGLAMCFKPNKSLLVVV